jgi:peptidoglycan hydrolase-like protein with peptidoglycan-binding domain
MADPEKYYDTTALNLYFKDIKDCSVDSVWLKSHPKATQTAPLDYVYQVQLDLIELGYLENQADNKDGYFGRATDWAVKRFQHRAGTLIRKNKDTGALETIKDSEKYAGPQDGIVTTVCAVELHKWITKKWVAPLGVFKMNKLSVGGQLRSDAATAWEEIITKVAEAGGTLAGPYGGTLRDLTKKAKKGTSNYSLHYTGRAVDINQKLADPTGRRYYLQKDPSGGDMYWILWGIPDKKDGSQGKLYKKGDFMYWDCSEEKEKKVPEGNYINLTEIIQSTGKFVRIHAQNGWDTDPDKDVRYNKLEWWHFQYMTDLQETFEDELELVGTTKKQLMDAGWNTLAQLGHSPG